MHSSTSIAYAMDVVSCIKKMTIKMKVPDFLRDELVYFVENRLEKGFLLYPMAWEPKELSDKANRRFNELSEAIGLTEKEKAEVERLVRKAWKQYCSLYLSGTIYDICLKKFYCKVIGDFWGRDPNAVYYESVSEQKNKWLQAILKRN